MTWTHPLTVLITGASSGFGRALTTIFAAHSLPPTIIATARSQTPPASLPPGSVSIENFLAWLTEQGHVVDILINCASTATLGPFECFSEEELGTLMQVNFLGPARLIRALVPGMRERRKGMVAHLGSGAGVDGRESMGAYGASKAAMDGLFRVLAKEMAPFGVRVLSVALGSFNTAFAAGVQTTAAPLPSDYAGTATQAVVGAVTGDHWTSDGDVSKGARAIYEVVMGIRTGAGMEAERVLPLGRDMYACLQRSVDNSRHALQTFEEVCKGVNVDRRA